MDVGLQVDDPGDGNCRTHPLLSGVDQFGNLHPEYRCPYSDLGGDEQLVGTELQGLQVDDGRAVGFDGRPDDLVTSSRAADSPSSSNFVSSASTTAVATSSRPIMAVPRASSRRRAATKTSKLSVLTKKHALC